MCLQRTENRFCLNPRVFTDNNVKLYYFASTLTLIALQGSVHMNTWGEVDNALFHIVKHLSLMLYAKFDFLKIINIFLS